MRIVELAGDGIGPEVSREAMRVLQSVAESRGDTLHVESHLIGWAAVQAAGSPLPVETGDACAAADAVFLGAVGDPAGDSAPSELRPERGLLGLRSRLGCWANLRPVRVPEALVDASALKADRVRGTDLLVVRELGGGMYYGEPRADEGDHAVNTLRYSAEEVRRIADLAFELAAGRGGHVTSVDKANVLEVSRLWRRVVDESHAGAPAVELDHMLVDRAAMEIVLNPRRFDVLLTGNLFGDILSDAAGTLPGSLGLLGSASLGGVTDLYEPVHGSAPEIAERGIANPTGAITSIAMMARYTFGWNDEAVRIEEALDATLAAGIRTADLVEGDTAPVDTTTFTDAVIDRLTP